MLPGCFQICSLRQTIPGKADQNVQEIDGANCHGILQYGQQRRDRESWPPRTPNKSWSKVFIFVEFRLQRPLRDFSSVRSFKLVQQRVGHHLRVVLPERLALIYQGHRYDWENIVVWLENPAPEYPKLLAASMSADNGEYLKYAPPDEKFIAGNAPLVKYESEGGKEHTLKLNKYGGELQELIMWSQLPEAARTSLNEIGFETATVPFKDATFVSNLEKAWPF